MKKLNFIITCSLLSALFLFACGGPQEETASEGSQEEVSQDAGMDADHPHGDHDTDATDQTGPEYTSHYICPMHCEGSGSATEGQCPACGMDYVLNEDFQEEEGASQPEGDAGMEEHKGGNG